MRLLFLDTHPNIRGPLPKIFPIIIQSLRSLGCDIFTRHWGQERESETLMRKVFRGSSDLCSIINILLKQRFDVLFINTAHNARSFARDLPLLLLARLSGRQKTVILFHGSQAERLLDRRQLALRILTRWELSLSHTIFLLSTEEQKAWQLFWPRGKFFIVRLPFVVIEAETTYSDKSSCTLLETDNDPVLLFVGRLITEKGVLDLIEAMPLVLSKVKCYLLIVGDGPARLEMQQHVNELDLNHYVIFAGYLRGSELMQAYRLGSVLVLPTYFPEGFPVVVMEAMNMGLPIITTCIRGVADWLTEPMNALFIPIRNPQVLSQRIIELLSDPTLMKSMSAANHRLVQTFEPMEVAREWLIALERISALN